MSADFYTAEKMVSRVEHVERVDVLDRINKI